ncbi:MAG: sulfurtransferase TusA family protein [Candidatus Syntropharchaeales archaeon]|uniref:SirA family protein n=1 Tax=Candidatus Syntropharchaeum caldarium TaxID=1838285 RepID=A0A1F2PAF1_9EURY|nr:MAG: SirA family protein [Candidatus Syntrophoarchaeum caldarius]
MDYVVEVTKTIDSRGSACPGPITDLVKAYRRARNGDVLEILATDAGIKPDATAWAKKTGNEILEIIDEPDHIRVLIKIVKD